MKSDKEEKSMIDLNIINKQELQLKKIMFMYESALKEIETKVNIISNEFQMSYSYNPIEHIKTRIKSPNSIIKKLGKKGLKVTYQNLVENINDVAGIRIICSFIPDIYKLVDMFERSSEIKVIKKKDYIKNKKASGYSSYHLIVLVPVSLSTGSVDVKVEVQIRTIAMDFWASLEHKIKYKYLEELPEGIKEELKECSQMVEILDNKMSRLGRNLMQDFEKDAITSRIVEEEEQSQISIESIIEMV